MRLLHPLPDHGRPREHDDTEYGAENREAQDDSAKQQRERNDHGGKHAQRLDADDVFQDGDDERGQRDLEKNADEEELYQRTAELELQVGTVRDQGREEQEERPMPPDSSASRFRSGLVRCG